MISDRMKHPQNFDLVHKKLEFFEREFEFTHFILGKKYTRKKSHFFSKILKPPKKSFI